MDTLHSLLSLPENASFLMFLLAIVKRFISLIGAFIIFWGACKGIYSFLHRVPKKGHHDSTIDRVRLEFGRTIVLGLEFIVASDVIETTMSPDYYSLGLLASLVGIRTLLTFFMNRELKALKKND